ncbi:MAG: hypothetical protein BroJett025_05850 [Patescibacteria group bacterium]|nr:MAG: hypothetical protein BroJett025_05850 [Patescibacteria group bacterium]
MNMKRIDVQLLKVIKHLFHPQRSNNHRPKFLHPRPLFFLSLIALGFSQLVWFTAKIHPLSGSILGYASNITVSQVVEATNSLRAGSGLQALSYDTKLAQAAIAKAQNMFSEGYWAHTSPSGKEPWDFIKSAGYTYRIAGENLARDFDTTIPMMDAWMNSPTHRANIMNPRYEEIGIAVVDGQLNGVETTLVVQMFGTPDTQAVAKEPSIAVPAIATSTTVNGIETITESETELAPAELEEKVDEPTEVLAEAAVPQGTLTNGILYSPQHVLKAFFLSIIIILLTVLVYDALVAGHKNSVRFVGKNVAHILLFLTVLYIIIAFKGGVVGP